MSFSLLLFCSPPAPPPLKSFPVSQPHPTPPPLESFPLPQPHPTPLKLLTAFHLKQDSLLNLGKQGHTRDRISSELTCLFEKYPLLLLKN